MPSADVVMNLALLPNLGHWEILGLLLLGLLLFGRKLPEVGRSVGRSIVEFKKGLKDVSDEVKSGMAEGDEVAERQAAGPQGSAPRQMPESAANAPVAADDPRRVSRSDAVATPAGDPHQA